LPKTPFGKIARGKVRGMFLKDWFGKINFKESKNDFRI